MLKKTGTETLKMLKKAYKADALGKIKMFEKSFRYKRNETSINDKRCSSDPSTSRSDENVDKIHEIVLEDRRRTI